MQGLWEKPVRRDDPTIALIQEKGDLHEAEYLASLRTEARGSWSSRRTACGHRTSSAPRRRRPSRRCATGRTSSSRRPSSTGGGAATPTSCSSAPTARARPWGAGATTSRTRSWRARSRAARSSRCASTHRCSRASRGSNPSSSIVITGDGVRHPYRTADYSAYFRYVRARFDARLEAGHDGHPVATYPDPVEHCRVCTWYPDCIDRRRADDHLSIVAGMRRVDTERLMTADVPTLARLAELPDDATDRRHPASAPDPGAGAGAPAATRADDRRARLRTRRTRARGSRTRPGRAPRAVEVGRLLRHRGGSVGHGGRSRIPPRRRHRR